MSTSVGDPSVFRQLRWRIFRNTLRQLFEQSSLRLYTILACSWIIWVFVFVVSAAGFDFLQKHMPLTGDIVLVIFDLLFLSLGIMLIFSSSIILYSSLFSAAEASFLLTTPAQADRIFAYKFQGALSFSSWAFVLLGSPLLIAYGMIYAPPNTGGMRVAWYFYALMPLYFLGYALIPGSLGALLCLAIVNFLPRKRKQVLILAGVAVVAVGLYLLAKVGYAARTKILDGNQLDKMLDQFEFSSHPLMPGHWMTLGLRSATRRDLPAALYYLALIWSNGLFGYVVCTWLSRALYRRGFNRLATGSELQRRAGGYWLDALVCWVLPFVDPQTKLLIVKDFRAFRRDVAQWAQVLFFTGLLALYSLNIRKLFLSDVGWKFQNSISLMNVCALSLLLCTYTCRFIYPMLSLEGRRFWILGLLPLQRDRLVWGKFAFSSLGCLSIAVPLVLLGDYMLEMPWLATLLHALTITCVALGLSGLSVGMGTTMPNFRETDPSKIAVGFGGTLYLITGLLFLLLAICSMSLPWHLQALQGEVGNLSSNSAGWIVAGGVLFGLILSAGFLAVPLQLGIQKLRRMEF